MVINKFLFHVYLSWHVTKFMAFHKIHKWPGVHTSASKTFSERKHCLMGYPPIYLQILHHVSKDISCCVLLSCILCNICWSIKSNFKEEACFDISSDILRGPLTITMNTVLPREQGINNRANKTAWEHVNRMERELL